MFVRPFATPDTAALYDVCLRTGDAGQDATERYNEPSLLGHVWLGAYLALEPELAWVVDDGRGRPLGYTVGALDARAFEESCERSWWPDLRSLYPVGADRATAVTSGDEALIRTIHDPHRAPDQIVADYPSQLHIDMLPAAQGSGLGRLLIDTLCAALAARRSAGVFVGVAESNRHALGFYRHVGFVDLPAPQGAAWLGRRLS